MRPPLTHGYVGLLVEQPTPRTPAGAPAEARGVGRVRVRVRVVFDGDAVAVELLDTARFTLGFRWPRLARVPVVGRLFQDGPHDVKAVALFDAPRGGRMIVWQALPTIAQRSSTIEWRAVA